MHYEIEPKGSARRQHEVHRVPTGALIEEVSSSRTEESIIGGVFVWLEALYDDILGPIPAPVEGKPYVPPQGISKPVWFQAAWGGQWAWVLWDLFDADPPYGFITKGELTNRWSSVAMRAEFGSPYSSPHIADYNGYLECMAFTVLSFRLWDADASGALSLEEMSNSTVWKKKLVTQPTFEKWAANYSLYPDGFMALLWNNFAEDTPLTGGPTGVSAVSAVSAASAAAVEASQGGALQTADAGTQTDDATTTRTTDEAATTSTTLAPAGPAPVATDITDEDFAQDMGLWLEAIHRLVDRDGNGKIEASEWYSATLQGKWADVLWHKLDKDGSGQIHKHEFQSEMPLAMLSQFGGTGKAFNAYFSYVSLSILVFRRLDADMDGHLKWSEIQGGPLERFTEKEGDPRCGNFRLAYMGVMTQKGFNLIAGDDGQNLPRLELEELVGLLAELFFKKL